MAQKSGRRGNNVVTIHEVARHAGVSPMTVSRVVNGESNVRESTRAKVAASIKTLHYSPNLAARSLASANAVRIGLLYSNPSSAYLSEFLVGSLEQSSLSGCQLVIEKCDGPNTERAAIEKLVRTGADGVILPPPLCDSEEALRAVADFRHSRGGRRHRPSGAGPLGGQHRRFRGGAFDDAPADRPRHSRIGFIMGHPNQTASEQRYKGFVAGMEEAGLKTDPRLVTQGYFTYRSGLEAAEKLLRAPKRPTAIFASNDDMAAATVAVAHRMGLDVPRDLTIAGFDDTPLATTVWPALTTVRQPIAEMAREAVKLLLEQIRRKRAGAEPEPVQKLLDFTLIPRESTGRVSVTSG